jgi:AI-2 transport protein TqsA
MKASTVRHRVVHGRVLTVLPGRPPRAARTRISRPAAGRPLVALAPLHRLVLLGAGSVVIAAGLRAAASTVNIVLMALLLAMTIQPIPHLLMRRGLKRTPAVLLTVFGVLVGGILITTAIAASLRSMVERMPVYEATLGVLLGGLHDGLVRHGINPPTLRPDPKGMMELTANLATGALGALGYGALSLVLVVLILLEAPVRRRWDMNHNLMLDRLEEIAASVRQFVALNGIIGGVQAALALVTMLALGTDFPLVWAALLFFLNFVPFGFAFALIPPIALTLLEQGVGRTIILVVTLCVTNLVADNVARPKMMGQGLGLSPLVVVLAFMFWACILGPMGALFAIPLTIAIYKSLPLLTQTQTPES